MMKVILESANKRLVWHRSDSKHKRYIVTTNNDGSCVAVTADTEDRFLNGSAFNTEKWRNWSEAPERRPMTRDEAVLFLARNQSLVVRNVEFGDKVWTNGTNFIYPIDSYEWATTHKGYFGNPKKFVTDVEV